MLVLFMVLVKIIYCLQYPVKKINKWMKKRITNLRKGKRPIPSVPRPCILKVDYDSKLDIDKWVNQARMYVEPLEDSRRAERLLMLVEETKSTSLESHCLVENPLNADEHVEHLLNVIKSMNKKKSGTPTQSMERSKTASETKRRCENPRLCQ